MANYFARKAGNINAVDVWATTPSGTAGDYFSSFTSSDVLMSNSFTVTLNVNTTVQEIRNDTTGGATAGGSFSISAGVTLTANIYAGTATCVNISGTGNATIVGNVTGATSGNGAHAINNTTSGTVSITGKVTGASGGSFSYGINQSSTTLNITGNCASAGGGYAIFINGGTVNVTGNVTSGGGQSGIYNNGGVLNITGTVTASNGIGTTVAAGSAYLTGTAVGGPAAAGVSHSSAGTVTVTRAKGGPLAGSGVGVVGSSAGSTSVEEIEYGDLGASPTSGPIRLTDKTSNVAVMYKFGASKKTLTDPNASGLMPAASNVRFGTIYNGGNSTGSCYVPAASSVAYGVNVDNTTGTAALTPAAVWDYLTSSVSTSGSIGERLKNCSTVASVGQALSNALS